MTSLIVLNREGKVTGRMFLSPDRLTKLDRAKRNREIREMFDQGVDRLEIAEKVGLSRRWVNMILRKEIASGGG